jgi:3-methyladenine DNA glycosylase/8-oxoguanine DNA glycosylase
VVVETTFPVDLPLLFGMRRVGARDPACRLAADEVWWALRGDDGPSLVRVRRVGSCAAAVQAWGPVAERAAALAPGWLGCTDRPEDFTPAHPVLADWHHRFPGLRMTRHPAVFDTLAATVIQQRVTSVEAHASWATLVRRFGQPAPRPPGAPQLVAPPSPAVWAAIRTWDWHRAGVEQRRAHAVTHAAHRAAALDKLAEADSETADEQLRSLSGVGVWTSAEVRQRTHGDPDAVSVGDWHLPHMVGMAFTGRRADDAQMLQLLEPYAGHRHRVVRLIGLAGVRPPRRGPRRRLTADRIAERR